MSSKIRIALLFIGQLFKVVFGVYLKTKKSDRKEPKAE